MRQIDISKYKNTLSRKNQIARFIWTITWTILARPFPRSIGSGWKRLILRVFGAKIHSTAIVYSSVKIYMPWKLEMHEYSVLASQVDCYNVANVIIEKNATVSQKAYLCTASHDIYSEVIPLIQAPIIIKEQAWVGADAYIGLGVTIGEGAVIGARGCVYKNVKPWNVVGGNPAKFLKIRKIE